MMVAAGLDVKTFIFDVTLSVDGARPKVQNMFAPVHTQAAL
jgi:hypothetical protein